MGMEDQAADDAQFSAGYDNKPTETPAAVKPEESQEAAPAAEPVDPVKELMARFEKLEQGHNKLAGHIGGIQRSQQEMQQILAAAKSASHGGADSPTQGEVKKAALDPKKWAQMKSDFPEFMEQLEGYLEDRIPATSDASASEAAMEQRLKAQEETIQRRIDHATLGASFPGWKKEIKTPEFQAWMESQPDDVKALSASSEVDDAVQMLRLYDTFKKTPPAATKPAPKADTTAREKRLAAAVTPRGTGGHATSSTEIDEFESGYSG